MKHPYAKFQNDPIWRAVEKGIKALVKNGDLEEKTARSHIVGYLTQTLHQAHIESSDGSSDPRRIIKIGKNEEVIVRRVVA